MAELSKGKMLPDAGALKSKKHAILGKSYGS